MKKVLALILSVLLVVSMTVGCASSGNNENSGAGSGEGKSYTLTVWCAEKDLEMTKAMCQAYAAANPQNEYKFLYGIQGENDSADKVLNDVTNGPDVFSFASDQINKLYAGGVLARIGGDLETYVKENNTVGSVDAATLTINGQEQLYAYPSTGDNCYFVYYDKSVYTNPEDLSSLDRMLEVAAAAGKTVHFKLNDDGWYLSSFFFANPELGYKVTYNENMVEEKVEINYDSADGLTVMQSLLNYVNKDNLVVNTDDSKIIAALTPNASGTCEAAAVVTGTWNRESISELLGSNMGVCKLPTANIGGQEVQLSGYMGYKLIGVHSYSKNLGEAHKLAAWLTNEQNQLLRFQTRGFGPTNSKVAALDEVINDPVIAAVMEQAVFNRTQKGVPAGYWTPMGSLITPMVTAKASNSDDDPTNDEEITVEKLQEYLTALCDQIRK